MIRSKALPAIIVSLVYLSLMVPCAQASPAFGPQKYIRTTGKPNVYANSFNSTRGTARLIVLNGESNGQNRLSSAVIAINGAQVFAPQDFSQNVYRLEKTISLLDFNNVRVELQSNPNSYLTLSIEPQQAPPAPPTIDTTTLPAGPVSAPYSQLVTASGGTPPYTWSVSSGALPQGLSLSQNGANGVVAGIPLSIGTSRFSVEVRDNAAQTATRSFMLTTLSSGVKPLLGYWSFDDGTGTDNSGFRTDGTLINNPAVVAGRSGQALSFDGTSQYVDLGPIDNLDAGSGELSAFAWIKTTQAGGSNMIISKRDSSDPGGYQLFQNSSGALSFIIATHYSQKVIRIDSTGPAINDGKWHFVGVVAAKNTIGLGTLYVDGAPATNGTKDLSSIKDEEVVSFNTPLRFGAEQQTDAAHLWQGAIDEVRIFTRRAFSAQEVANMYSPGPLSVVSDTLPAGAVNVPYNQALTGSGGTLPYFWSKASGTLPPGISVSQDGTISGTPTAAGPFTFSVVLDDASAVPPVTKSFSLTINATPPSVIFSDNFTGANNWILVDQVASEGPSVWVIANGEIVQRSNINDEDFDPSHIEKLGTFAFVSTPGTTPWTWPDYDFSLRLMSEDNDALGVMFRIQDDFQNYYRFSMDSERFYRRLVKVTNGVMTSLKEDAVPYQLGRSYNLRVSVVGDHIRIYLDNTLVLDVMDPAPLPAGRIALYTWGNEYSHFGDVLVTTP